jgi:subfamily B ATP-binding cassette protein MsbA
LTLTFRILRYLRPYLGVFTVSVVATFLFAALDAFSIALLIPFLETLFAAPASGTVAPSGAIAGGGGLGGWLSGILSRFMDLSAPPAEAIQGIIVFLLFVFLFKNLFDFLRNYLVAWIEQAIARDLKNEVYGHLVELDLSFFGRTRVGQIMSRLTHDVEQLRILITKQLAKVISSVFELIAALVVMVLLSWELLLAALVVLPIIAGVWGPLLRRIRKGDQSILDLAGNVNSHLQETLSGIRLVKGSGAENHERARFQALTGQYFKAYVRTERFRVLSHPLTETMSALGTVVILWYGTRLVLAGGGLPAEEFIVFLAFSMKLYTPVKFLGKLPAMIQPGVVAAERVFEFLDAPIEIRDAPGSRPFEGVRGQIAFEGVSFQYRDGEPVLQDVSLEAPAGTVTALVGPSGAGKTTLMDLLGRFYEPTAGRITLDGQDLRDFEIASLRQGLGIVSQETVLFHDTVRSNLAYGLPGPISDEALERAARAANAHEFIARLPLGYDTVVGERGTQLSGGQRQRIAIARAILRDPPILILDEATSALDSESERLVQAAIERLLEGRTVFVIAHRLSTIQRADQILVMEAGRVVQRGRHDELLAMGGLYRHLHDLQFSHPAEGTPSPPAPSEA